MIVLLDLDIYAYRVAWTTQEEPFGIACARIDEMLDLTLAETKANEFMGWLSDNRENNYRFKLCPDYKANREHQEKPIQLEPLKEYLIDKWGAKFAYGMEADDALGIEQIKNIHKIAFGNAPIEVEDGWYTDEFWGDSVIASIDKDLLQIPGKHYNFVKKEFSFVTPEEALRNFYIQLVQGDVADNIRGCEGIGPKKAAKLLGGLSLEQELFDAVFRAYRNSKMGWDEEQIISHLLKAGRLLKIKQAENEPLWEIPK